MYKKFLFLFSICFISIFSLVNVQALTTYDETLIQNFYDTEYDQDYPLCLGNSSLSLNGFEIFCIKPNYLSSFYITNSGSRYIPFLSSDSDVLFSKYNSNWETSIKPYTKFNFSIYNLNYLFSNFDFYSEDLTGERTLITSNFQFKEMQNLIFDLPDGYTVILKDKNNKIINQESTNKYKITLDNYSYSVYLDDTAIIENNEINFTYETTIKPLKKVIFNIPESSDFVLQDIENNVITSSNNTYYLPAGDYIYSLSKSGYFSKKNIQINITDDITFNLTLDSRFNSNTMSSIFTQYYNYIKDLVVDIFPLENPLFVYLISIFIGFFLIALIRKLIGGIV